jgi:hypothetical protein
MTWLVVIYVLRNSKEQGKPERLRIGTILVFEELRVNGRYCV